MTLQKKDSSSDRQGWRQSDQQPRVNVLGLGITPLTMRQAVETIEAWIVRREKHYICLAAVHSIMACRRDPRLFAIINRSGMTTSDGMPLVWLLRASGYRQAERVYGPDLMSEVCRRSLDLGWRHYFVGGDVAVAAGLRQRLAERYSGIALAGHFTPPRGEAALALDDATLGQINRAAPDIIWVGLGTALQERWMAEHRPRLEAPVLIGVGAAFDFLSGTKPQAPRWMQRSGFEWLFRLSSEPGRLWPRYREYPLFVLLLIGQMAGLRHDTKET